MQLKEWMKAQGLKDGQLAERLGCDQATVWRWRNGRRQPDAAMQRRIFEITGGAVTPNDWAGLAPPTVPPPPFDVPDGAAP